MRRIVFAPILVTLALLVCLGSAPAFLQASPDSPQFTLKAEKGSFIFTGSEKVECSAEITSTTTQGDCALLLRIYRAVNNRSELEQSRNGKPGRLIETDTLLEDLEIQAGNSYFGFQINLTDLNLSDGVYPYTIALSSDGQTLASEQSFLVIRSKPATVPLNLVLLWTAHQLPAWDFSGEPLSGGPLEPPYSSLTFMDDLLGGILAHPEVKSTLALAPMTYADTQAMGEGFVDTAGNALEFTDPVCERARELMDDLREGAGTGALSLMPTTYGYADLEALALSGWDEDVARQIGQGQQMVKDLTERQDNAGFFPPHLAFYNGLIPAIQASGIRYTVISQDSLEATKDGSKLLDGPTLAQPVNFGSADQGVVTGFVADERIRSFLEEQAPSLPSHQVLQNIFAELSVLADELPNQPRVCTLLFPDNFTPDSAQLEQLYATLNSATWLQTLAFDQALTAFPVSAPTLELPAQSDSGSTYISRLSPIRELTLSFKRLLFPDNPLAGRLDDTLLRAESADFLKSGDEAQGDAYLAGLQAGVEKQMSMISLGIGGSITLSSRRGNIPVLVINNSDYPVKATLRVNGQGVEFPDGEVMRVVINPKENRFEFPVVMADGGSQVNVSIEQDGLLLDTSTIRIKTSSINALAIWLLLIVAALLILAGLVKFLRRRAREKSEA